MADITKAQTPSLATQTPDHANKVATKLAGEDIAAGDVCYIKTADDKIWRSDGSAADAAAKARGITVKAAKAGQPVTLFRNIHVGYGSGLTPGADYYVSVNPGALADAASTGGTAPVAFAVGTQIIYFHGSAY